MVLPYFEGITKTIFRRSFTVDVFHKFSGISQDLLGISLFSLGMVQGASACVWRMLLICSQ